MGNLVGVGGGGNFSEQVITANGSIVAGTIPAAGKPLLAPASVTSSGVVTGGVNRQLFNSLLTNFQVGAVTAAGAFTATLQHSNDDGVTDAYVNVPTGSAGWGTLATAAGGLGGTNANTDTPIFSDLRLCKPWVRWNIANTAGTSAIIGATGVLAASDTLPAAEI